MKPFKATLLQPIRGTMSHKERFALWTETLESLPHTHLVVFPAFFASRSASGQLLFEPSNGETSEWLRTMARRFSKILVGSLLACEEDHFFHRLIWMQPDGQHAQYDQRHPDARFGQLAAGTKRFVGQVNGWKIHVQVCRDLRYPVWSRQQIEQSYDILLNVAHWPASEIAAWDCLLRARAIENECFVLGFNDTADAEESFLQNRILIDPSGSTVVGATDQGHVTYTFEEEKLAVFRQRQPFLRDADRFLLIS